VRVWRNGSSEKPSVPDNVRGYAPQFSKHLTSPHDPEKLLFSNHAQRSHDHGQEEGEQDPCREGVPQGQPEAKNQEVVDALAKKGITLSANYVATSRRPTTSGGGARKVVAKGGVGIPEVKAALTFLRVTGSVAKATKPWQWLRRSGRSCRAECRLPSSSSRRSP